MPYKLKIIYGNYDLVQDNNVKIIDETILYYYFETKEEASDFVKNEMIRNILTFCIDPPYYEKLLKMNINKLIDLYFNLEWNEKNLLPYKWYKLSYYKSSQ